MAKAVVNELKLVEIDLSKCCDVVMVASRTKSTDRAKKKICADLKCAYLAFTEKYNSVVRLAEKDETILDAFKVTFEKYADDMEDLEKYYTEKVTKLLEPHLDLIQKSQTSSCNDTLDLKMKALKYR